MLHKRMSKIHGSHRANRKYNEKRRLTAPILGRGLPETFTGRPSTNYIE